MFLLSPWIRCGALLACLTAIHAENKGFERVAALADFSSAPTADAAPRLTVLRADYVLPQKNQSVAKTPLQFADGQTCVRGLGVNAESLLRLSAPQGVRTISALIGVDDNPAKERGRGGVVFAVRAEGKEIFTSPVLTGLDAPQTVAVDLQGARTVDFIVRSADENPSKNHADWGNASVVLTDGSVRFLDELALGAAPTPPGAFPFSFVYGGQPSEALLPVWTHARTQSNSAGVLTAEDTWRGPNGVVARLHSRRFADFPAYEWTLWLENDGDKNSAIFEAVNSADFRVQGACSLAEGPTKTHAGFRVFRTEGDSGAMPGPWHFQTARLNLDAETPLDFGSPTETRGRSSQKDFPFFKIERAGGAAIFAVGWSGQWFTRMDMAQGDALRVRAGVEGVRFYLKPGEKVRLVRALLLDWEGDSAEANAQFRQLIARHYVPNGPGGKPVLPLVWANTWAIGARGLNDIDAAEQIALIQAVARVKGVEYFVTDAGWYRDGFNISDGDYAPHAKRFPEGLGPVSAAAEKAGMGYGLWFDIEKVFGRTDFARTHPEWLLASSAKDRETLRAGKAGREVFLRNLGDNAARENLLSMLSGYLSLPGFAFYRQDFNASAPLSMWNAADAPDRKGITQIQYIMGLYAVWDALAEKFPNVVREECASGGRRIDLETVSHMHVHQKSDYRRNAEDDQSSIWGLSQYLPNSVFATLPSSADEYDFLSAMPAAMALGWKFSAPNFDAQKAQRWLALHARVRPLLTGAWYPLTAQTTDKTQWLASQYHRADLDEGVILAYRRADSPYAALSVDLRQIRADKNYTLTDELSGETRTLSGAALAKNLRLPLEKKRSALVWRYAVEK